MKRIRRHLTFANITAVLALVVALGGTGAYAASLITSKQIKNGTIKNVDIHTNTIRSGKLAASARSLALAHYDGSPGTKQVSSSGEASVQTLTIPKPGTYLITATGYFANGDAVHGGYVTCNLVAGSESKETVASVEPADLTTFLNSNLGPIAVQTIAKFSTKNGSASLNCSATLSGVYANYIQITALKVDSASEVITTVP